MQCHFCGGEMHLRYRMGAYSILQCRSCRTGMAHPMPDAKTLQKLYNGFLSRHDMGRYPRILAASRKLFRDFGARRNRPLRLLDIGGGGGYFCRAFEELDLGESTYVDLDPQSCRFAREKLGLKRVIHGDALDLDQTGDRTFDLIYTRHLIEHLVDPTGFISRAMDLLDRGGRFVAHIPNGRSLEYFAYPHLLHPVRFRVISQTNGWRMRQVYRDALTRGMLHGIDPPRHLWAITGRGMRSWAERNHLECRNRYYSLWNLPYSPHFKPDSAGKIFRGIAGRFLLAPLRGGTHLVAILSKP